MRDYREDIGSLFRDIYFKDLSKDSLVLLIDVKKIRTSGGMNHYQIIFQNANGEHFSIGSEGFYLNYTKVS